jgi:hypothetical protein
MRSDVRPASATAAERLFARAWDAARRAWEAHRAAAGRPCGPRSPGAVRPWERPAPRFLRVEPAPPDPRATPAGGEEVPAGSGGECGRRDVGAPPPRRLLR